MMADSKRSAEGVADLASVPSGSFAFVPAVVALCKVEEFVAAIRDLDVVELVVSLEAIQNVGPHGAGGFEVHTGVLEGDVDPRFKGLVEDAGAVGGEEEDARVVLQLPQEH